MTNVGSIIGAILLITLAGIFNGSWNASFSPRANLAVGKNNNPNEKDLSYHHSFALFQIYAVIINIPICIYWAGGIQRVSSILAQTPPLSIFLIALFSIIWGVGTLCFGIACKIAGVGFGTNLSMGIVAIIGTFLPLITEQTLLTPFGGVICIGLFICCVGLWLATKALAQRDIDEANVLAASDDASDASNGSCVKKKDDEESKFPLSSLDDVEKEEDVIGAKLDDNANDEDNQVAEAMVEKDEKPKEKEYSTLQKILVCLITGIAAVQLQFAFIFGKPITDLANGKAESVDNVEIPGQTPFGGSAAIIWLLAISLGAPVAIINGILSSPVPLSHSIRAPWWRHVRIIVTTSLPWISHIHIYGLSATKLFPEKVAASIAWPLLMMITNLWSLVLSKILGEWKVACDKTIRTFVCSVATTMVGLLVLMCSVAVPTNQ